MAAMSSLSLSQPLSNCPGGLLSKCIELCPSTPSIAYKACVEACVTRCSNEIANYERGEVEAYRR